MDRNTPLSIEQLTKLAEQKRATLRNAADAEIAWRQYAVDQGKATSEESSNLIKWQDYQTGFDARRYLNPIWPTPPGEQVVSVAVQVK
ncbi:tail fiber assembly protein [Citrobacter youngae]|uniref:tail fiber assembly protein n=1 Tax=Citrobacter youngae TaxID=133448 RepID=UPI0021631573|nr:tail fiber assembly protein [Citrobacter youngae]